MALHFSLHSVHGGVKTIDEIHQRARRAEELGYDGIFIGESHLNSIDSFQTLATCALLTQRLLLGIAVTNMVFRHPTVLAGAAASLNEISKGRAILGLGTGDGPVYSQGQKATPLKEFEIWSKEKRSNSLKETSVSDSVCGRLPFMYRQKVRKGCGLQVDAPTV
jgi:alkanesulfonate monooxygenase SsuD/methylene tetrahydromethanopterin reductase-like flavin-dependent oxidoreductase (luciferase family)